MALPFPPFKTSFLFALYFFSKYLGYSQKVVIDSVTYNNGYRTVRLFIPAVSSQETAPLTLVMLDGQNLFDDKTSYAGEWQVDEFIASLPANKQAFVIGIDHGNALRVNELTPFKNKQYGGGDAAAFLEWITIEVLPVVSTKYNISLEPNRTAIAGSSLGGLFAHYAATMQPAVFMASGIFSPALWIQENYMDFVKSKPLKENQFFYLSAGTSESTSMIPDMHKLYNVLKNKTEKIVTHVADIQDAKHNEAQWRDSFPAFYKKWLAHVSR